METLYEMIINNERKFLKLGAAGITYDSNFLDVSFGDLVIENGDSRKMTREDKILISEMADEWSSNK